MTRFAVRRIQVVQDNYLIAAEKAILDDTGAEVVGPFSSVANAQLGMLQCLPDCAVMDVNGGEGVDLLDLARRLRERYAPLLFFTGYDEGAAAEIQRLRVGGEAGRRDLPRVGR